MLKKLIIQFIKFGIVGIIATVIDVGVLTLLKELCSMDVLIASAISFAVSVTANYVLSMLFVFKSNQKNKVKEFIIFVSLSVGGLLLNQLIMWLGTDVADIYYLLAKLIATVFVTVYNFISRKMLLEKKER